MLAPGATTVAYDYIGPEVTWDVYHHGTIGRAKIDLRRAAKRLDAQLKAHGYGRALISVNKALVTQASSAIPVVRGSGHIQLCPHPRCRERIVHGVRAQPAAQRIGAARP